MQKPAILFVCSCDGMVKPIKEQFRIAQEFEFISFSKEGEALAALNAGFNPAVIIFDFIAATGMSGYEIYDKVIAILKNKIPGILVCGSYREKEARDYARYKNLHFLKQPFSYSDLCEKLQEILKIEA